MDRLKNNFLHGCLSKEDALTALLEYLSSEGHVGEGVQVVANDLDDQHQDDQALQVIWQQECHDDCAGNCPQEEQGQYPSCLFEHILDLRDGRGQDA